MGNHRKLLAGAAAVFLTSVLAIGLVLALRPAYSVRQLRLGLECNRQGQYALAIDYLSHSIRVDPSSAEALFARGKATSGSASSRRRPRITTRHINSSAPGAIRRLQGICSSRSKLHRQAIAAYQTALQGNDRCASGAAVQQYGVRPLDAR